MPSKNAEKALSAISFMHKSKLRMIQEMAGFLSIRIGLKVLRKYHNSVFMGVDYEMQGAIAQNLVV